jgi:hypothetical protein
MSKKAREGKSAAEIARQNGWTCGNVLRAVEYRRADVFFQITAVGYELVLGRKVSGKNKYGNEIKLPLTDEFIRWERI